MSLQGLSKARSRPLARIVALRNTSSHFPDRSGRGSVTRTSLPFRVVIIVVTHLGWEAPIHSTAVRVADGGETSSYNPYSAS